jgi:hypothetical protein
MLPHPETICTLKTMEYQERLREAAKDRLAASVQQGRHAPTRTRGNALRIAALQLGGCLARLSGPTSERAASPRTNDQAWPARHGA